MSEGWDRSPGTGTEIDAETDDRPGETPSNPKGGWVALPPHPDAPEGAGTGPRYRAPWASGTTASIARSSPTPAPSAAPTDTSDAPARPGFKLKLKSRRFTLKRKAAPETPVETPVESPSAPVVEPEEPRASIPTPTDATPPAPPAAADPTAEAAPAPAAPRALEFTGSAGEYFRVWIVNVCLTALTFGIYSAWAKVRTRRYFYRHTRLEGSPFDYLARPGQILKGRVIVALFFATCAALGQLMPAALGVIAVAMLFLVPWAVMMSLRFRAHNVAWRNIRFGFDGTYRETLAVFVGWPLLVGFTFGLAYPYYQWRRHRFVTERSRFGTTAFGYGATPGAFYRMHLKAGVLMLGLALLAGVVGALLPFEMSPKLFGTWAGSGLGPGGSGAGPFPMSGGPSPTVFYGVMFPPAAVLAGVLAYFIAWTYAKARTWNVVWNGTTLGPHGFACTVRARELLRLYLMNTLGVIVSFGLLVPWARVRMARYRVEHMQVTGDGALTDFAQAQGGEVGATGAELGEAMNLDLGL